ncbi:MAG: preprotein translocase subunit SecG [Spirochaetota bacterium]
MTVLISVGTVVFLILSFLLVILILLQSDKSAGMGILGGSSQSTFGSSTADIITKITGVMVAVFMLGSLGLAVLESYRTGVIEKEFNSDKDKTELVADTKETEKKSDAGNNKAPAPVPAEAAKDKK